MNSNLDRLSRLQLSKAAECCGPMSASAYLARPLTDQILNRLLTVSSPFDTALRLRGPLVVGRGFITTYLRWISSVNTAGADRGDPLFATSQVRWYTSGWRVSVSAAIAFVLIAVVVSNLGGLFENTTYLGMRLAPALQLTVNVKGTLCCSVVVPEVMLPVTVRL